MKYTRKAIEVEAVQWNGTNIQEISEFGDGQVRYVAGIVKIVPDGSTKIMRAEVGDWIVRDTDGDCYPCTDSVFRASYHGPWDSEEAPAAAEPEQSPADIAREHARARRGDPKGIA